MDETTKLRSSKAGAGNRPSPNAQVRSTIFAGAEAATLHREMRMTTTHRGVKASAPPAPCLHAARAMEGEAMEDRK
jgi:hypothetical protein